MKNTMTLNPNQFPHLVELRSSDEKKPLLDLISDLFKDFNKLSLVLSYFESMERLKYFDIAIDPADYQIVEQSRHGMSLEFDYTKYEKDIRDRDLNFEKEVKYLKDNQLKQTKAGIPEGVIKNFDLTTSYLQDVFNELTQEQLLKANHEQAHSKKSKKATIEIMVEEAPRSKGIAR